MKITVNDVEIDVKENDDVSVDSSDIVTVMRNDNSKWRMIFRGERKQ